MTKQYEAVKDLIERTKAAQRPGQSNAAYLEIGDEIFSCREAAGRMLFSHFGKRISKATLMAKLCHLLDK